MVQISKWNKLWNTWKFPVTALQICMTQNQYTFFWEDSPVPKTMQDIELELLLLCPRRRSLLYWCIVLSVLVVVVVIGVLQHRKISYRNWQSSFPYMKTLSFFLVYLEVNLQSIKSHREDETHSECRHSILWNALHCFFPLIPSGCLLDTHWVSWDKTMKKRKSCQILCSVTPLEGWVLKVRAHLRTPYSLGITLHLIQFLSSHMINVWIV